VRESAQRKRAAAFVDYRPIVCGVALEPLTLPRYTTLLAWKNPFIVGGAVDFTALVQFVWLHHPAFAQPVGEQGRVVRRELTRLTRRIHARITPRFPLLNQIFRFLAPLPRFRFLSRFCRPTFAENFSAAVSEGRRIVDEAMWDFPAGGDDAEPLPFAQKPQLVSLFTRGHNLSFAEAAALVDTLPLKQLVEYLREILHRLSRGREKLLTAEEARIWADYLEAVNEPASASSLDSQPSTLN